MATREEIKEEVKSIFSEDMLLCFWTHEKCPPSQQEFKQCQLDSDIKHERCMPCWEKWVDGLVDKVLKKEHELGLVIKVERELPDIFTLFGGMKLADRYKNEIIDAGCGFFEPLIGEK